MPVVFASSKDLGLAIALEIRANLDRTPRDDRFWTLGFPSGRSCMSVLAALATLDHINWSRLRVAMPDAYVTQSATGFRHIPDEAHHSARRFFTDNIGSLALEQADYRFRPEQVWIPDPQDPGASEAELRHLGVDMMLLASGTSDGHVAFNGPGALSDSTTAVVPLGASTRRDNLRTYPDFGSLAEVPGWGVTVGIDTIRSVSREAILVLPGQEKARALARVCETDHYDSYWPATVIHECPNPRIYTDSAAASA